MALPETPSPEGETWWERDKVSPNDFFAAYSFDAAETRQEDVAGIVEEARRLGYPVRYWWLSDAMELRDERDRLILCVHHPTHDENAGMDLYQALKEHGVRWDDLESAAFDEYIRYSRAIAETANIRWPDTRLLFPQLLNRPPADGEESLTRDDEPLFVLTVGDVQAVAHDILGRALTPKELKAVMRAFYEPLAWPVALRAAMEACQTNGSIGPAIEPTELVAEPPFSADELQVLPEPDPLPEYVANSFLVHYLLSGLMLLHAPDAKTASKSAFGQLHTLIGKADAEGVTPGEASLIRFGDLYINIDTVEAIEFPTLEP